MPRPSKVVKTISFDKKYKFNLEIIKLKDAYKSPKSTYCYFILS